MWIRYELWCIARAASTRYCMVHCEAPEPAARAWNAARPAQDAYSGAVLDDLWRRFEEPDSRNRWDQPLFRVATATEEPESRAAVLQVCACSTTLYCPSLQGIPIELFLMISMTAF